MPKGDGTLVLHSFLYCNGLNPSDPSNRLRIDVLRIHYADTSAIDAFSFLPEAWDSAQIPPKVIWRG